MPWAGCFICADHGQGSLTCNLHGPAGNISVPGTANATYTFTLGSDDGSMLYIDGALVVNNTGTVSWSFRLRSSTHVPYTMAALAHPLQALLRVYPMATHPEAYCPPGDPD